jgi:Xanthosine triphosphate pyrophosphatase
MKIVLASNNPGKLAELQAMLAPLGVELLPQGALGVGEAEEPYCTFVENALAKARFAAQHTGLPALADDAGLCVDAFGGLPGVQTAYYATQFGYAKGDANNVRALLEQMRGITDRRAALVSTLVAVRSPQDPEPLIAVGRASGRDHRSAARQPRLRLRPRDVPARTRQNLCRAAARSQKRAQPPRPGRAADDAAAA